MSILKLIFNILLFIALTNMPLKAVASELHNPHKADIIKLHLNKGLKWHTDKTFKKSMLNIQGKIKHKLKDIHQNKLLPKDYKTLADNIQNNLDIIISKCKLAPKVDEQAHFILLPMLNGAKIMRGSKNNRSGAIEIIKSLNLYPQFFEHPNWIPIE